jgi:hypothetical protein
MICIIYPLGGGAYNFKVRRSDIPPPQRVAIT